MDHNLVQNILDNAGTRGVTIISRTIKEMVKDKKTILVALVSLIPIILGLIWSHYLSDSDDINSEYIEEISATGDVFCYVDVPESLPDSGNYTFNGYILNRGDTTQRVAVNLTLGPERSSTGLMNVTPMLEYGGTPHFFSLTMHMDQFEVGFTFITVMLYVEDSVSSANLLPDTIDWWNLTGLDFSTFDPEEIIGSNSAVFTDGIEIKPLDVPLERGPSLEITKNADLMPLTLFYPAAITPDQENDLNFSIRSPMNESHISVSIQHVNSPGTLFGPHFYDFETGEEFYNSSIHLPEDFGEYAFNVQFIISYEMTLENDLEYTRWQHFTMDLVKEEYIDSPDQHELVLANNSLYTAQFMVPTIYSTNTHNNLEIAIRNSAPNDVEMSIQTNVHISSIKYGTDHFSFKKSYDLMTGELRVITMEIPLYLIDHFPIIDNDDTEISFQFQIIVNEDNTISEIIDSNVMLLPYESIKGKRTQSMSDSYRPSIDAVVHLPEDLSLEEDTYVISGWIQNDGGIEKDFTVRIILQNEIYYSESFLVAPNTVQSFTIEIDMGNHSREFDESLTVEVYSTRNLLSPEATQTWSVNIIEESHKERKVMSNFLWIFVQLYLKFIVPLVSMVYGISLISQESDRKTLPLYLTTPITKVEVILYKFAGYLAAMTVILTIPLIFIYFSMAYVLPLNLILRYLLLLGVCIFDLFLAIAAYGAIFTAIGTFKNRAILIGMSYLMIWEVFLGSFNFFLTKFSVFYHLRCAVYPFMKRYVPDAIDTMALKDFSGNDFTYPMEYSMAALILVVFMFLFVATHILNTRDID